jgi:hypothetical protein
LYISPISIEQPLNVKNGLYRPLNYQTVSFASPPWRNHSIINTAYWFCGLSLDDQHRQTESGVQSLSDGCVFSLPLKQNYYSAMYPGYKIIHMLLLYYGKPDEQDTSVTLAGWYGCLLSSSKGRVKRRQTYVPGLSLLKMGPGKKMTQSLNFYAWVST